MVMNCKNCGHEVRVFYIPEVHFMGNEPMHFSDDSHSVSLTKRCLFNPVTEVIKHPHLKRWGISAPQSKRNED